MGYTDRCTDNRGKRDLPKGTEEIEATFGESLPTLVDKIRKVR